MPVKHPVMITALVMLLSEVVCFVLAPLNRSQTDPLAIMVNLEYIPYMLTAMTIGFLGLCVFTIAGIVFLLKGVLYERWLMLLALMIAFLLPIIYYYAVY